MEQANKIEPTIYKFSDGDTEELGGSQPDHQGKSIRCPHCDKEILLDVWLRTNLTQIEVFRSSAQHREYKEKLPRL